MHIFAFKKIKIENKNKMTNNEIAIVSHDNQMIDKIINFMTNNKIKEIGQEFDDVKKSRPRDSFNVFQIISDKYKRENLHSKFMGLFLNPNEIHNEGTKFMFAFIDFINKEYRKQILKGYYNSAIVKIEENVQTKYCDEKGQEKIINGKIDILIKAEEAKRCIIIENKSNNAPDTTLQLPKYYKAMEQQGYKIDAIVYIPLDIQKQPNQSKWSDEDKRNVLPKLCILPAYQDDGKNLVKGWIEPCTLLTKNLDCISTLRQFGELLKKLNNDIMVNSVLNTFYQSLIDNKSLYTAISVRNMLCKMPSHMAERLYDTFNSSKQTREYEVWRFQCKLNNHCGIIFKKNNLMYKIDIWTSENPDDAYGIYVFEQNQYDKQLNWAKGMDSLVKYGFEHHHKGNDCFEYKKTGFSFYDEEKVIQCVNALIDDFHKVIQEENQ
ncbi:MAG: PD-(D/E)XK nuclease family protein [Bacteroidales bacterium]|nr:PD-(D/E)XK nuclease family protein [Bacteroidales bacterium]